MIKKISNFVLTYFSWFIFGYAIFLIIVRLLVTDIAVLDESEQLVTGNFFALGYNQQPPLYSWIQNIVFQIFGISILSLSLLKNFFIFIIYLFIYKLGILIYQDKEKAVLGALSLMLVPQIVWSAQVDQVHTVMLTAMSVLTVYWVFKMLYKDRSSTFDFVVLGLFCAMGFLAKYNFLLVVISLLIVLLFNRTYRIKFFEKRLWITIGIGIALVLPHVWWAVNHFDFVTGRTVERMGVGKVDDFGRLKALGSLGLATLLFISPFWLFFLGFFGRTFNKIRPGCTTWFLGKYMINTMVLLVVIVLILEATNIKERWLQPYLVFFPLFAFGFVERIKSEVQLQRYIATALAAATIASLVMILRPWLIDIRQKPSRANYPFSILAQELRSEIENEKSLLIYGEDKFIAGNLKLFFSQATVYTPHIPFQPYKLGKEVLFVYSQKNKPSKKIDELVKKGYLCKEKSFSISYYHSNYLKYSPKITLCKI